MADPLIIYEEFRMYMPGLSIRRGKTYVSFPERGSDGSGDGSIRCSAPLYTGIQQVHTSARKKHRMNNTG